MGVCCFWVETEEADEYSDKKIHKALKMPVKHG